MFIKTISSMVLIASIVLILPGCKKKNTGPSYTAKMGGMRLWSGYSRVERFLPGPLHTEYYEFSDSAISIADINGETVVFAGITFNYTRTDSLLHRYDFEGHSNDGRINDVTYDYIDDKITFLRNVATGGAIYEDSYHSN